MRHHIDLSRWQRFLLLSLTWTILSCVVSTTCWDIWKLDVLSSGMGLHVGPVTFGLLAATVPAYFTAIETWLPIRRRHASSEHVEVRRFRHWDAVRIVVVLCIFATEFVVDTIPSAVSATTSTIATGIAYHQGNE